MFIIPEWLFYVHCMYLIIWKNYPQPQDDGTYEVIKGSDFMITRTAFRDNSSKYYINDKGSSFTEVTKKLKGKGIDLDNNRFLILQVSENKLFLEWLICSVHFIP